MQWNLVGYARVSTEDQNLDLQLAALRKAGVRDAAIYREHVSGVAKRRPQLRTCLDTMREGDVLVIWKLDRLGRDLVEVVKIAEELRNRGIELRSLTEQLDTTSAYGKFFFHVIASFAQLERDLISERTRAGIAAAKARGKVPGRRPGLTPEQWAWIGPQLVDGRPVAAILRDPALAELGWPDKPVPSRATIHEYKTLMAKGAPYPAEWKKYVDRTRQADD
jgi:DNA invertase Pin-like site-specific DNA recombinase